MRDAHHNALAESVIGAQARLSPDARFMAYLSNESKTTEEMRSDIFEVYVRPFDATKPEAAGAGGTKPAQVSTAGARGMVFWRQDGKELYYLTPEWGDGGASDDHSHVSGGDAQASLQVSASGARQSATVEERERRWSAFRVHDRRAGECARTLRSSPGRERWNSPRRTFRRTSWRRRGQWQPHLDPCAFSERALDLERAPMRRGDLAGDRQSEPRAVGLGGEERIEHVLEVRG